MKRNTRNLLLTRAVLAAATVPVLYPAPALAAEAPPEAAPSGEALLSTLITLIRTLVDQGVLTAVKAQDMLRQAGVDPSVLSAPTPTPPVTVVPAPIVRVPYVPQTVKDELREDLKQEVLVKAKEEHWADPGALPAWLYKINWYGDVRFRVEREDYPTGNSAPQDVDAYYQLPLGTTLSTTHSRDQLRLSARLGVDVALDDNFRANVRLVTTTGDDATASPVSANGFQGRYGRPFSAGFDTAYLQWSPNANVKVTGGRFINPYLSSDVTYLSSDLIWYKDLGFDGLLASFTPRFGTNWDGFIKAGAHPLTSNQLGQYNTAPEQWLFAGQTGVDYRATDASRYRFSVGYFSYVGIQGDLNPSNPPDSTLNADSAPLFRQRGNTMVDINWFSNPGSPVYAYAGQFKELELDANVELAQLDPLRLGLDLDYVRNVGFNAGEIASHIGPAAQALPLDKDGKNGIERPRVSGYQFGLLAGRHELKGLGDWQAFGGYRYLERDAVVDAFTSPDYHLGGTDQKGPYLGVNVGVGTNASVVLRYSATRPIDAPVAFEINQWYLDFLGRF
jgi:hypothetical protein